MSRILLIKEFEKEIAALKLQIQKREEILKNLLDLEGVPGKATRAKRGPGRPAGIIMKKKPGRPPKAAGKKKPGRPPKAKETGAKRGRKPGRPAMAAAVKKPLRRHYAVPVGDMIMDVLKTMRVPAVMDDLVEKVHKKHPDLGGVKYKAIVPSIITRDPKFKRVGRNKVKY